MNGPTVELSELVQRGYRFALSLTHNPSRAEDLVQDAWFAVLRANGPLTAGYLFKTIKNRFIDQLRRDKRVGFEQLGEQTEPVTTDDASTWNGDEPVYLANGSLKTALDTLRPEERAVLYLASVEDYTAQQLADLLGRPRGTVLSLIHRAKAKLRDFVRADTGMTT